MKIPLFDLDGTLFKSGNEVKRESYAYAYKKVFGVDAKNTDINPEGMVDSQMILEVLKLHGISEKEIKSKIKLVIKTLADYFKENKSRANLQVLPGVRELLVELTKEQIPMGILTGNVEQLGWTRLEMVGIKQYFTFGAFGDQTYERVELVEIARKNAEKVLGKSFETSDFVIVGDTPKDIKCARDAGIKVIIVATGFFTYEQLEEYNPNLLLHTLEEKEKILNFLSS